MRTVFVSRNRTKIEFKHLTCQNAVVQRKQIHEPLSNDAVFQSHIKPTSNFYFPQHIILTFHLFEKFLHGDEQCTLDFDPAVFF